MAQAVQCLPNKYEAMSSNPSTKKKKTKQKIFMHAILFLLLVIGSYIPR
jgi:hypothetical protein